MAERKTTTIEKRTLGYKTADPEKASIDLATQKMIARAQALGIDTVFDRAASMKPCNIGVQGICCKNCGMGQPQRVGGNVTLWSGHYGKKFSR